MICNILSVHYRTLSAVTDDYKNIDINLFQQKKPFAWLENVLNYLFFEHDGDSKYDNNVYIFDVAILSL